ncbi:MULTISPECIES: hypothetical protein [unclassified Brevundimonas]|jgi:hypothetical protein|uniref:hypothetical protein n=1 Tax=unclassified Brevundimonas TaxID=2622653 RepID=UPI000C3A7D0D|nr:MULTISPECIES: hypothetical protein [unclassified Brevundimonas]MAL87803.1 hypothetical protein [Brevundimonas sp.]HAJ02287.1 hypothetical protein [Brevundimonas sp.]|tara:strand:+ start:13661 stop:14656 length:996 start_codon:yes stop_codon:yes gene_type:complete
MRRLILFLVLALALIVGLNIVSRVFDDGRQIEAMNALLDDTSGKEAIIVGSSIGGAIRFDTLCLDGADFFFVLQDVFETRAMVELVLSRPDPPGKWFLALSPGATLYNNAIPASGRSHNRRITYRFLFVNGRHGLIDGDWRQYAVTRISPALGYQDWRRRFQQMLVTVGLRAPAKPIDSLIWRLEGQLDPALEGGLADGQASDRMTDINAIAYYDPGVSGRAVEAISDIHAQIEAAGGQLYIIVPPASPQIQARIRRQMDAELQSLWRSLDRIEEEGAVVINAWRDPARVYPAELFVDPNHMNPEGARLFSRDIAASLKSRGHAEGATCPG